MSNIHLKNALTMTIFVFCIIFLSGCYSTVIKEDKYAFNIANAKKNNLPIIITAINPTPPNSASGVGINLRFINTSDKTVKYAYFTVEPYNTVHDKVFSDIGNTDLVELEVTGPIKALKTSGGDPEAVWYNWTVHCIKLKKVEIKYMDGTKKIYKGKKAIELVAFDVHGRNEVNKCFYLR